MEEIRVKINKKEQKILFKEFNKKLIDRKNAIKFLKVKYGTYNGYCNTRIRYIPKDLICKICSILKRPLPKILESRTLLEIRQKTIRKTYPVLRRRYGENWAKVIAKRGHKTIEKIYGKEWKRILAKRGYNTSKKLYGNNFQKRIWQKAMESLENKYGKEWAKLNAKKAIKKFKIKYGKDWGKILMKNARKAHFKRYGENWAKVLSKKGAKKLREKYGIDYHREIGKLAILSRKQPLTYHEKTICKYLKRKNIKFETHCIKNGREYDIIIPNLRYPKIVIESSNSNPTIQNQRMKILQLSEQKRNFPNAINLAILSNKGKSANFHQSTYNFLMDQKILVFWYKDLKNLINMIKNYLDKKNKNLLSYRYDFNETKKGNLSLFGALGNKNKVNHNEIKLHKLLNKIKANPQGAYVIQTKYNNSLTLDNLEIIKHTKIAYEITSTTNDFALKALTGKIIYLKKLYKNMKFIVILSKVNKLKNNLVYNSLYNYANVVVLSNQFDEAGLTNARNQILNETSKDLSS